MIEVADTIRTKSRKAGRKGAARQLRMSGYVPAVAYGPTREPRHLSLDPHEFVLQRRKFGRSHLYEVEVDGADRFKAFIKDIQIDPCKRHVLHVDLYEVDLAKPIRVSVRIDITGKAKGVVQGGVMTQVLRRVDVQGLPEQIPDFVLYDVSDLGLGQSAKVADLVLPEGVQAATRADEPVVSIVQPAGEEDAAKEGEEAATAEGTAAKSPEGGA